MMGEGVPIIIEADCSTMSDRDEPCTTPIEVMDSALFFINNLVDLNIEMQELIIEIRKRLIKNERGALEFLHEAIERAERLKHQFTHKVREFRAMEQQVPKDLFARFYGRVSEKMFSKFLYYSLNNRSLQFTTGSLLELFRLYQEMHHPKYLNSFDFYTAVVDFVISENRSFAEVLLELIVSEDYVSSLDEFFILKGIQRPEGGFTFQPDDEKTWQRFIAQDTPKQTKKTKIHHRNGQILQSDFRNKLQDMVNKYQDGRLREEFLNSLSQSILRQFEKIATNQEEVSIFKRFNRKLSKSSFNGASNEAKRSGERKNTVKNKHRKSQHGSRPDKAGADFQPLLEELRSSKENEFFVGTHSANILSKISTPITTDPTSKTQGPSHYTQTPAAKSSPKKIGNRRESQNHRLLSKTMAEGRNVSSTSNPSTAKPKSSKSKNLRTMKYREEFRPLFERLVPKSASNKMSRELVFLPRNIDSCLNLFQNELDEAVGNLFSDLANRNSKKVVSLKQNDMNLTLSKLKPQKPQLLEEFRHAHMVMSKIQQSMVQRFGSGWQDALISQAEPRKTPQVSNPPLQENQELGFQNKELIRCGKSQTIKLPTQKVLTEVDEHPKERQQSQGEDAKPVPLGLYLGRKIRQKGLQHRETRATETSGTIATGPRLWRMKDSRRQMEIYNTSLRCLLRPS